MIQEIKMPNIRLEGQIPRYVCRITTAHEGFIVDVSEDIILAESISRDEFYHMMGDLQQKMQAQMQGNSEIARIQRDNELKGKQSTPKISIVGPHIFLKFSEMQAFLTFVYEENIKRERTSEKHV